MIVLVMTGITTFCCLRVSPAVNSVIWFRWLHDWIDGRARIGWVKLGGRYGKRLKSSVVGYDKTRGASVALGSQKERRGEGNGR